MKKFLSFSILAAAALTMTPAVNAQEADYNYTNIPPAKDIYTHSWRDNWYIQLGAGAQRRCKQLPDEEDHRSL